MNFKDKYIKYKSKYTNLKNFIGGEKVIGNLSNNDIDKFLKSNIKLVNGHGAIDITKWYVIPENTYIITTTKMGSITHTCNKVFSLILNDNNKRKNLKTLLKYKLMGKEKLEDRKDLTISQTYKYFYNILEPGDIIPKIVVDLHHEKDEDSAIIFYTNLNISSYSEDDTNYSFLNYYKKLIENHKESIIVSINTESIINLKILLNLITLIYEKYKSELTKLEQIIEENDLDCETYMNVLNGTNLNCFIERGATFKLSKEEDRDDLKFVNMLLTLFFKTDDIYKTTYDIKEIIDSMPKPDSQNVNIIILTSCLHTKDIYNIIYKNHKKYLKQHIKTDRQFFNKNEFSDYQLIKDPNFVNDLNIINFLQSSDYLNTISNTYYDFFPTTKTELIINPKLKMNIMTFLENNKRRANKVKLLIMNDTFIFDDISIKKIKKINDEFTLGLRLSTEEVTVLLIKSYITVNTKLLKLIFDIFLPCTKNFNDFEKNINYIKVSKYDKFIIEYIKLKNKYEKNKLIKPKENSISCLDIPVMRPVDENKYITNKLNEKSQEITPDKSEKENKEIYDKKTPSEKLVNQNVIIENAKFLDYKYNELITPLDNIFGLMKFISSQYDSINKEFDNINDNESDLKQFISNKFKDLSKKINDIIRKLLKNDIITDLVKVFQHKDNDYTKTISCIGDDCFFINGRHTIKYKLNPSEYSDFNSPIKRGIDDTAIGIMVKNLDQYKHDNLLNKIIEKIYLIEKKDDMTDNYSKLELLNKYFITKEEDKNYVYYLAKSKMNIN